MARLGALRQLHLDHLHLRFLRLLRKLVGVERAVIVAAAKVTGGDFPDDVAAMFAVILRHRAFAGVVREVAFLGAEIERHDRVSRERAEAHRRHVEDRQAVRLSTVGADQHAEVMTVQFGRRKRVADPLVPDGFYIEFGAVGPAVDVVFCPLIDDAALDARERLFIRVALDEILADFRPDELEQETQMAPQRVVAQDRVALLHQIEGSQRDQQNGDDDPEPRQMIDCGKDRTRGEQRHRTPHGHIASRKHGDSIA